MLAFLCSCLAPWDRLWSGDDDGRIIEKTNKFSLAVGGVAPGRDELVLFDETGNIRDLSEHQLDCASDKGIITLSARPGTGSLAEGSGALIVPNEAGIASVTCSIDGVPLSDTYEVIVSPQDLIRILVAEAGTQLADEASLKDDILELTSASPTGNAIGAVIRNRIDLIEANGETDLFSVDAALFEANPTASYYEAVITAPFQFSPTYPLDSNFKIFSEALDRNFLEEDWLIAYDQAVLTAAGIYSDETKDPTEGSFAFFSPTVEQWLVINEALNSGTTVLPDGCGVSDETFPALAPVQIVMVGGIWTYEDGMPAFVFVRHRIASEAAVINLP